MSFDDYNPSRPTDRSKYSKTYRFTPRQELAKYDLPFAVTRVPLGKLPPLDADAKQHSVLQNNVTQYLPPLDHGLKHINKLRANDSLFRHDEYLMSKKSQIYRELLDIRTGEESIAFFSRNGLNNPVKFITCEKKYRDDDESRGWENRPYDLKVTGLSASDNAKASGDYFTVTMHGIIIYKKDPLKRDKYLTEFLSLAEWMRQSTMFDSVSEVRFFKYYPLRKILLVLHNKVRRIMFLEKRRTLMNKLFLTKPAYAERLMDLKYEIWNFPIDNIFDTKSELSDNDIDVDKFLDDVILKLESIRDGFDKDLMGKVKVLLADLCKAVKKKTVTDDDIFKYDKHKPLIYQSQEANLKKIKAQFAIEDNKMLLNFLKLVQNMMRGRVYDEYLELIGNYYREIREQANKGDSPSSAAAKFFKVTVSFSMATGTSFKPDWDKFSFAICQLFDTSIAKLDNFKRLLEYSNASDFSAYVDLSQYDLSKFKSMSAILKADTYYNRIYAAMVHITQENWDSAVLQYQKHFEDMQNIVVKGNQFNPDEYNLGYTDEEYHDIENKERIDGILHHVKAINEEYGKLDKYNSQLKELTRCKHGILDFNMTAANEDIKKKVIANLEVLKRELKNPTNSLESYIKENINKARDFMVELKEYSFPQESDDITEKILKDYYEQRISYNFYAKQDGGGEGVNYLAYLGEVRKALEESLRYTGTQSNVQSIQKQMKEINQLHVECDKVLNLAKNVIEIRLDQDIKDNDVKIKAYTADLIEDHKEANSLIYDLDIGAMTTKYTETLANVKEDKRYFEEYKALLGSKVNEYEMQSLDEFINKSQSLLEFYEVIRSFLLFEKSYYHEVPVVELMEVDNYNYKYNDRFDVHKFVSYIEETRAKTANVKKVLKLELVNNFYKKIEQVAGQLEIVKLVACEDLRYAHWADIHEELGMKIQSEVFLHELFHNNITNKVDRLRQIAARAAEQRKLRTEGEKYLAKWLEYPVQFSYSGEETTISNYEEILDEIKSDVVYIKFNLLTHPEKMIVENELTELLSSLNLYEQVMEVLRDFQILWTTLSGYFEDLDVQHHLMDENKRFREFDRFFRAILNNAHDVVLVRKVIDVCMKTAKRSKLTNFDQLKNNIVIMREFKEKTEIYKAEMRQMRINTKIFKYDIRNIDLAQLPEVLTGIIFRSDYELDDREDLEDDMYSAEADEIFHEKKGALDADLSSQGIYNDNIKPWYYKKFNRAILSPTGKVRKEEKLAREYYDVWQIGVVLLDFVTKGLISEINELSLVEETEDPEVICRLYVEVAQNPTPYAYIKEVFSNFLEKYEGHDLRDFEDRIDDASAFISDLRMEYNEDIENMLKNSLHPDKNERCTLEELLNFNFIKKIWGNN